MMIVTPLTFLVITLTAFLGALVIIALMGRLRQEDALRGAAQPKTILLFNDGVLTDATPDAANLLGPDIKSLKQVIKVLRGVFPTLSVDDNNRRKQFTGPAPHRVYLDVERHDDIVKLRIWGDRSALPKLDRARRDQNADLMDAIATHSPQMVWQENADGVVVWSNAAFAEFTKDKTTPFFQDFQDIGKDSVSHQQRVASQDNEQQWFDITTVRQDGNRLNFAHDATALVCADKERRDFVHTLGKTFADLSIGLAIFDKSRHLAMFNPALLDMTNLPVAFLSARPSIDTVLDRLRELQMMPEPKDYASWREQFTAFEVAAKDGTYTENWALPDGQTYRVTGRPHPDGAFAILFEDISAEVSLTRRFRSDIETSQAVLDTLPDAIAVFTGNGTMVISNAAYERLWMGEGSDQMNIRDLKSELMIWQDHCIASPIWTEMRDFLLLIGGRRPWSETAMLDDGRHLRCHATPIAGGMTMVRFVIAPPMQPVIRKLTQIDDAILATKA